MISVLVNSAAAIAACQLFPEVCRAPVLSCPVDDNVAAGRRRHGKARISMTGRSPPSGRGPSGRVPSVRDCFQISGKSEPRTVEPPVLSCRVGRRVREVISYHLRTVAGCAVLRLRTTFKEQRRGGHSCLIAPAAC